MRRRASPRPRLLVRAIYSRPRNFFASGFKYAKPGAASGSQTSLKMLVDSF
jgi:hypothetical protein